MANEPTPEFPLFIEQGVDFEHTFLWLGGGKFMAPIEHIQRGYPTVITVSNHMLNSIGTPIPIIISGVNLIPEGALYRETSALNSEATEIESGLRLDDNRFSIPVSTVNENWQEGTGEITYFRPTDLTGYTGACQIRKNWYSEEVLYEMTTENGGMTLTPEDGGIALYIPGSQTALFDFQGAVYDVDLVIGGAKVRVFRGPIRLLTEITK